ncbi:MAG: hypothetical protein A2420_00795 [Candidatus Moranbacteria bacterium RIFOXYC1_FULL_44_13]|nr:MAG: hypothetical protein A2184_03920 [Candidatus Moranbacteria bacterium RIFOXYA1_FULL_44_7]OGI32679.1 MAG: hypothetical protein A2420_00795 [Candidatus Moranbacteria bacterium RIFOXYC1_FULL_44_13]OGI37102.1 MAG: hypothetical protein A2612_04715 [Candidatus Moranbacteria bacterium RIFOXYD1_FULL_44_12]
MQKKSKAKFYPWDAECIAYYLYIHSIHHPDKNKSSCLIKLGKISEKSLIERRLSALDYLKGKNIITNFSRTDNSKTSTRKKEVDKALGYTNYTTAEVVFHHQKNGQFIENIFNAKKTIANEIQNKYLALMDITEIYLKEPIRRNVNLSEEYEKLVQDTKNLALNLISYDDFYPAYRAYLPFQNLLEAPGIMSGLEINIENVMERFNESLTDLQRLKSFLKFDFIDSENTDLRNILGLLENLKAKKTIPEQKKSGEEEKQRLIKRGANGDYYFNGNLIEANKKADYFAAFDILFTQHDANYFLSYEDIEEEFVRRGLERAGSTEKTIVRISNALHNKSQGFFRLAKVNGKRIKNEAPDGKEIVSIVRGKGLELNNPVI